MRSGMSSAKKESHDQVFDPSKVLPYGDTLNDGMTQVSFSLPLPYNERSLQAAKILAGKM